MPGRPARNAVTNASGSISGARLVFTSSAVGFILARSAAVTMWRVASTSRICREMISHCAKKPSLLWAVAKPIESGHAPCDASRAHTTTFIPNARPYLGHGARYSPVSVKPQRAAAQCTADTDLPPARLQ